MDQQATCAQCHEPLFQDSLSCSRCGLPVPPEQTKRVGPSVSILGALFVTAGPFLPWLSDGIVTANGILATKKAALIFVGLGVFGAMFSLSAFTGKKFTGLRGNIAAGFFSAALSVYLYIRLPSLIAERDLGKHFGDTNLSDHFGSGIYFCAVGSVLLLLGGILTRSPKVKGVQEPKAAKL